MFRMADELGYDWYLGLDADVVLKKNWYKIAMDKIEEIKDRDYFNFSFAVQDKFLGIIDRGNHFYNGKYNKLAMRILEEKTRYTLKPESSICSHIKRESPNFSNFTIGFHGHEQYYKDIFYRFWLRRKRGGNLSKQSKFFKDKNRLNHDKDFWVAKRGWDYGRNILSLIGLNRKCKPGDCTAMLKEVPKLLNKLGIKEKSELKINLNKFYQLHEN